MKKILGLKISAINTNRSMQKTKLLSISVKSKTYKGIFITAPKCSFHLEVNKPDKSLNPMEKSYKILLENRSTYPNGKLTHTHETNIIDRVTQMNLYSMLQIFLWSCALQCCIFLWFLQKPDRKIEFYNVLYFIELTDINEVNPPFLSYVASEFCVGLWVRNLERVAMSYLKGLFFLLIIDWTFGT